MVKAVLGQIICTRPQASLKAGFLRHWKEIEMVFFGTAVGSFDGVGKSPKRKKDWLALLEESVSKFMTGER